MEHGSKLSKHFFTQALCLGLITLFLGFPQGASGAKVESPGVLTDGYGSVITSYGNHLWLAVTGEDKAGRMRTEVLQRHRNGWKALPGGRPLAEWTGSLGIAALRFRGDRRPTVCVSDSKTLEVVRLRCFRDGRWIQIGIDRELRGYSILGLRVQNGVLFAVFLTQTHGRQGLPQTIIQVARLKGNRLVRYGPSYSGVRPDRQLIADLGDKTPATKRKVLDVAVHEMAPGGMARRWVATFSLRARKWVHSRPLPALRMGSLFGSARSGGRLFFPVSELFTGSEYWPFSVYTSQAGRPWRQVNASVLNVGGLNGQGWTYPVGNRIWVLWVENGFPDEDGMLETRNYAALLSRDGSRIQRKIKLWEGRTVFPGLMQAIQYRGRPVFTYLRQAGPDSGMQATVAIPQGRRANG